MTTTETKPTGVQIANEGTVEWRQARSQGIGASEAAAVCGLDPYQDALSVWYDKVIHRMQADGADEDAIAGELDISTAYIRDTLNPPDLGDDVWFGSNVQPVIAAFFERQTGLKVLQSPAGMYQHPELEWMRATPDALIESRREMPEGGEWKSLDPHYAQILGVTKDATELPADAAKYHLQAQWQCEVVGFSVVHFGILIGRRLVPFEVSRDDRITGALKQRGAELWERVINLDPPDPDYSHRAALTLQKELHQQIADTRVELTAALVEIAYRNRELREQRKEIETELDANNARLLAEIGNHAAGVLPDGKEIRRIGISEKEISYVRKSSVQIRECKVPKGAVVLPPKLQR